MSERNDLDMDILEFIKEHEPVSLSAIVLGLPGISEVEFRVKEMCPGRCYLAPRTQHTQHTNDRALIRQDVRTYLDGALTKEEYLDSYRLTDMGHKVLQDYRHTAKNKRRELWIKNAWIPILVSLATNLVIDGTKWLLPQIIEWLSHIH